MTIEFNKQEKEILVSKLQAYMNKELEFDLGQFDAEFLIDFISEELGNYYYNRGVYDAKARVDDKVNEISEALYDIEKPTSLR